MKKPPFDSLVWGSLRLAPIKFGSGASLSFIKKCCRFSLEVLEQSHKFEYLQEKELPAACVEGRWTGLRALLHALHDYALHTK